MEAGGGSVRIHDPQLQKRIFRDILNMDDVECQRFQHLLTALGSGCPPHAGIALGLDRLVALLCGSSSIRDVVAFPKTSSGNDLVVQCPTQVSKETLAKYHLNASSI